MKSKRLNSSFRLKSGIPRACDLRKRNVLVFERVGKFRLVVAVAVLLALGFVVVEKRGVRGFLVFLHKDSKQNS